MKSPIRHALALVFTSSLGGCAPESARPADHRAVIQARVEASNAHDWDRWESLHDPAACRVSPELAEPLCGADVMRAAIEQLVVAFPDYHLEIVDLVDDGDRLVVQMHTTGTMNGPLLIGDAEIPANGRTIEQDWVAIVEFSEENLITGFSEYYDQYILMVQLGLAPEFGP